MLGSHKDSSDIFLAADWRNNAKDMIFDKFC